MVGAEAAAAIRASAGPPVSGAEAASAIRAAAGPPAQDVRSPEERWADQQASEMQQEEWQAVPARGGGKRVQEGAVNASEEYERGRPVQRLQMARPDLTAQPLPPAACDGNPYGVLAQGHAAMLPPPIRPPPPPPPGGLPGTALMQPRPPSGKQPMDHDQQGGGRSHEYERSRSRDMGREANAEGKGRGQVGPVRNSGRGAGGSGSHGR